jgi:oligopeptide/dipeptide ABC transporter ATP-binding protein
VKSTIEPLLKVENLKTYFFTRRGIVKAVDGVNLYVRSGETLGLLGESGCGKSVTALSVVRLVPQPAGRIVGGRIMFEGEDLLKKSLSEMRQIRGAKIAMILQDPLTSLNPVFTIGSQVSEVIRLHQHTKGMRLWQGVIEAMKLVRIPDAMERVKDYPHMMSGGMRQRIVGAIALSCQPSLLITDEPTTSLDVTIQVQYLTLIQELQDAAKFAMIIITHDFGIVVKICDRIAVMYAGKIVETADTRELFNNPRHPYTEALFNCLPRIGATGHRLAVIEGQPPDMANLARGCSFAPRCPKRSNECDKDYPPEITVARGHYVNCWRE